MAKADRRKLATYPAMVLEDHLAEKVASGAVKLAKAPKRKTKAQGLPDGVGVDPASHGQSDALHRAAEPYSSDEYINDNIELDARESLVSNS